MDNERREQLKNAWDRESEAPESMEWRDELSPEELDVVSQWDRSYSQGVLAMASAILVREKIRKLFDPRDVLELETIHDHCRLQLRDGRMLLARLDRDGSLRLDEIDEVC